MKAAEIKKEMFGGRVNAVQQKMGWAGMKARYDKCSFELKAVMLGLETAIATARVDGTIDIAIRRKMTVSEVAEILSEVFQYGADHDSIARHLNRQVSKFEAVCRR